MDDLGVLDARRPIDPDRWHESVARVHGRLPVDVHADGPVRVAFVGQRTYFEVCSQTEPTPLVEPAFVEFRAGSDAGSLVRQLVALAPHVVIVFRPEILPPGVLRPLEALTLGFVTEPLPRAGGPVHPDLERRVQEFAMVDPEQFDRVVTFDPHIVDSAERYVPVWRSMPLPVDDRLYVGDLSPRDRSSQPLFVGRSTPHREQYLVDAKHRHDLLHVEHGVHGVALRDLASRHLVAVNLHNEPYPSFENRVPLHLATGNLVISEPLSPTFGLEPDLDYLEARSPGELLDLIGLVAEDPVRFEMVRVRGHQKAQDFLASRVYAGLLLDLFLDVAAFGGRER